MPPLAVDGRAVGSEQEEALQSRHCFFGLSRRQTKAVAVYWSCGSVPELDEILRRDVEILALPLQAFNGRADARVIGVKGVGPAEQDVCVGKVCHYSRSA